MINHINTSHLDLSAVNNNKLSKEELVAKDFEAIFMRLILNETMVDDSEEMKTFKGMYNAEISQSMASGGGFGLGDLLVEQWRKNDNQ